MSQKKQEKRQEVADRLARKHADANRSDPFAYGRMHMMVMNGIITEKDFSESANGRIAA